MVVERNEKVNKRSPSVGNDASVNGDEDGEEEEEEDEDEGVYPVQKLEFTVESIIRICHYSFFYRPEISFS